MDPHPAESQPLAITLSTETLTALEDYAAEHGITPAESARRLIVMGLFHETS